IEKLDARANTQSAMDIRKILHVLHFSDETILDLKTLVQPNIEQDEREHIAGKLSVSLRDSRSKVENGLEILQEIGDQTNLSVEGKRLVRIILIGKYDIRSAVASQLMRCVTNKEIEAGSDLIVKIEDFNAKVVALDNKLGGFILH
ncbi:hypothetical protein SAMN04488118_12315, partial [Epibacterium ulvae]